MNKDYLIKLTFSVFRLAENWEETNFLKFQIINFANQILIDFILLSASNPEPKLKKGFLKNIELIQGVFIEARNQKLIERKQYLLFQKEYRRIKNIIEEPVLFESKQVKGDKAEKKEKVISSETEKETIKETALEVEPVKDLNERQKKILEILKNKPSVQVWELKQILSDVSKRTLRRDLDELLKIGLVKRQGEWNEVFYNLAQ